MNTENIDINQLRKAWVEMGKALGENPVVEHPEKLGTMKTTLDKLRVRYQRMGVFALSATLILCPILLSCDIIAQEYVWSVVISFAFYLLLGATMDFWLMHGVGQINPVTMTVSEVSKLALYYKRCHIRFVVILLPIAFCWIGFFIFATQQTHDSVMGGIITGAVIGSVIGGIVLYKFMADYKKLAE